MLEPAERAHRVWIVSLGLALPKFLGAVYGSAGVSLRARLNACWNGFELDKSSRDLPDVDAGADELSSETGPDGDTDGAHPPSSIPHVWTPAHKQLADALWTHGFIVPGGAEYVQELVGFCRLTAAETMLEIGLGMGGGTRAIINKFGNYVTGYEHNGILAEEAHKQAITYDIDDKLNVINLPLREIDLKSGYFRAALIRDVLSTVEDKERLIGQVCQSLKSGEAYLIITDFLFDEGNMTPEVEAWVEAERSPVYPWTIDALKSSIESRGVLARIVEDESDRYCSMVTSAWSRYLAELQKRDVPPELGEIIANEANLWGRRTAALQSGGLRYYRIEGSKKS